MRTDTGKTIRLKDYTAPEYTVDTVYMTVSLDTVNTIISTKTVYNRASKTKPGTPLMLDGDELDFVNAKLDGVALGNNSYKINDDGFELLAPPENSTFELEITTRCKPDENTKLMGLFQSSGMFCTDRKSVV